MKKNKAIYYNDKQIDFVEMICKVKVTMWGRGTGKTRAIAEDIYERASHQARAKIFLAAYTYDQIDDNIMPDIHEVLELHGLREGIDYVVGKRPPKSFQLPYKKIEKYSKSISFFNGFAVQLISLGRYPNLIRGRSFDGGILDEGLLINQRTWSKIVLPTMRGYDHWRNGFFKMISIYTSRPTEPEANWIFNYKKLAKKLPKDYYYSEANAYDNLYVLGEDYIPNMEQQMTYTDFQIEILNKELTEMPDHFYHKYNFEKHTYSYEFELDGRFKSDKPATSDYDPNSEIDASLDFGGTFTCMTTSQERKGYEYFIKEFDTFMMTDEEKEAGKVKKLPDIITDFANHYADHVNKVLNIYGDRQGTNEQVTDVNNLYEDVAEHLEPYGWSVNILVTREQNPLHKTRWFLMNECFNEKTEGYPIIRINAIGCPNLCISLKNTRIKDDFKKDKKDERNKHFNQQHAPHYSDTIDYKITKKYMYLLNDDQGSSLEDSLMVV